MSLLPFSDALRCLLLSVFQHFQDWRANVYTHAQKLLLVVNKPSSICVILLISDRDMAEGIGYWLLGTCSFRCGLGLVFDLPFGKAENVLTCGLPEFSTRLSVRFCCFSQLPHFKNA